MTTLTREELARGRALLKAAFDGPWRYNQWTIDCDLCNGGDSEACVNPECLGAGSGPPVTFVEAPHQYPANDKRPQIVATIDVPGMSDLAQQNGEVICWLRNEAESLISANELLLELRAALEFINERERHQGWPPTIRNADDVVLYAKRLGWSGR